MSCFLGGKLPQIYAKFPKCQNFKLNLTFIVAQLFSLRGASRKLSLRLPNFEVSAVHHCMGGSQNFTLKQTTKPISLYLNYDIKRFSVQTAGASQQLRKAQIYHITCYVLLMTICNSSFPCVFRCGRLQPSQKGTGICTH